MNESDTRIFGMLLDNTYCPLCKVNTAHENGNCTFCRFKREEQEHNIEENRWAKLSLEQRIEELRKRIEDIEMDCHD